MYRAEGSLIPFRRMPDDKQETRAAISRRKGDKERNRTHESPNERRSEHERKPEREAEAGEQGAGGQGAGEQRAYPRRDFPKPKPGRVLYQGE